MQFARILRSTPETFYTVVTNVDARSLTTGWPVALRLGTNASLDFHSAVLALSGTAADLPGFLGVADVDIATNAIGRVICFGYARSVWLSAVGTSLTVNNADPMVPGAAGFFSLAPTYVASGFKYVLLSNRPAAISAGAYASGYVKGL